MPGPSSECWARRRGSGTGRALERRARPETVPRAQIDHPWAVAPRERLRAKYLQHLLALGRAHEAEGRWEEAVSWYRRGIEADELVEAFYQRLIRCYQHLGRTAEARATSERCRRVLAAELGTPPSAETLALIRTLGL